MEENIKFNNSKIAVLNITKQNIKDKLSKDIYQFEYSDSDNIFNFSENEIFENTNILCVIYCNELDIKSDKIKQLINTAKSKDIDIYLINSNNKKIEEIICILNELSNMLLDKALINIDIKALKGQDIIDAFIVCKKDNIDLKKDYEKMFNKYIEKYPKTNQVVIYVCGGRNTKLGKIFSFVEMIRNKLTKEVDIIFGCKICEDNADICKVMVIFQGGGKKAHKKKMLDDKIQKAHENFSKSDYMSIQTIEEEVHNKEFYNKSIEKFCELDEISFSTVQKYLRVGYPRATKMIDEWEKKGYIKKDKYVWEIIDKNSIFENLKEFFKDKI